MALIFFAVTAFGGCTLPGSPPSGDSGNSAPLAPVDMTAPATPSSLSMSPAGPANNNSPKILGTAETSSTLSIYATNNCLGSVVATGSAASFASPGIPVSVSNNTTTSFTATTADAAGNVSACSSSVSFVEDSTAPTLSITTPTGGAAVDNSNQQDFTVSGACTDSLSGVTGRTVTLNATGTTGSSSASATCDGSTYSTTI
ncbi:MAG: hypothetical protein HYW49_00820, partial [Deltaproteobacteria bacterium]|nr:hypothetical protein [Deltaproteobacteria bacterium]